MFVIPVSGAGLGLLVWFGIFWAWPGLLGTLIKWAIGLFVAYLVVGGMVVWHLEGRRLKKEAQK